MIVLNLFYLFSIFSISNGILFKPFQSAKNIFSIDIPYFVPEGVTYHAATDRFLVSSLATGEIRSFPNTDELDTINKNGTQLIYSGTINGIFTPVVGIKVYGNTLYGAVGAIPPLEAPFYGGLLIIDLQNPSTPQLVDFSSLALGKPMILNDVVYSTYANAVFVTDFYGYRIFRYDLSTSVCILFVSFVIHLLGHFHNPYRGSIM